MPKLSGCGPDESHQTSWKKISVLSSELGILLSILSTLSVPLVSREVMCAVSSEAPLLSGLQKTVLSVHGVIAVFHSERGKIKPFSNSWKHGIMGNPVTNVLVEQRDKKLPRGYKSSVCQAGNCKMPVIELVC